MKLWLNERDFIQVDDRKSLNSEIAVRSRSLDWMGIFALLPDPDTVLQKTGQDITVYRQTLADPHTFACYISRKSGTLSCEWQINPAKKGPARANKVALQLIKDLMDKIDVYQVITDMLEAPFYGMSPIEVVWKATESNWLPERIEGKPPEWFAFDPENHLRFLSIDNMIMGEEVPGHKFLLPRHHASYQNPYGERILARCFWPVVFKKGGFKFWAIFTEKYGMPWLVGKVPRNTNETERASLLSNLSSMVQDAVAVINNDESIEMPEASGKKASADIYEKLISAANKEISKATVGQTATTEGTPGKLGNETAQMEVREDLVDQDKRMVSQAFNTLFQWITELNVQGAVPPEFGFYEEENIHNDLAGRDEILTKQGVRLSKKYYMRTYNLEEQDLLDVGAPAPAAPTGPAAGTQPGFAEGNQGVRVHPTDIIAEKAVEEASMDPMLKPVKDLLDRSKTLQEFRDGLMEQYGSMDATALGDLMTRALALADLSGRYDAF